MSDVEITARKGGATGEDIIAAIRGATGIPRLVAPPFRAVKYLKLVEAGKTPATSATE